MNDLKTGKFPFDGKKTEEKCTFQKIPQQKLNYPSEKK